MDNQPRTSPAASTVAAFDPRAPLPGAPSPWASSSTPNRRAGPPYHMTEMIEAEPALAVRVVDRLLATDAPRRLASALRIAAGAG
ncbi:MAG TPA: hypothetical protein VFW20_09170, partial [Candidatus Limnocylindrales bacterium]|nr:hypothetical protein [Candidatus Limnocylindrales bacterium]